MSGVDSVVVCLENRFLFCCDVFFFFFLKGIVKEINSISKE